MLSRYSREEPPLLGAPLPSTANTPDSPCAPTICARCGSRLICELQLVPEFAETLRILPNNVSLSHLHFLSVLIFTCSQSCWLQSDTLVTETVVFQPEVVWIYSTLNLSKAIQLHNNVLAHLMYSLSLPTTLNLSKFIHTLKSSVIFFHY